MASLLLLAEEPARAHRELGGALQNLGHDARVIRAGASTVAQFVRERASAAVLCDLPGWQLLLLQGLSKLRGVPVAVWIHQPLPTTAWAALTSEPLLRAALRGADVALGAGPAVVKQLEALCRPETRVHSLHFGHAIEGLREQARRYPGPGGAVTFAFRSGRQAGLWELVAAFRRIRTQFGDRARLWLDRGHEIAGAARERLSSEFAGAPLFDEAGWQNADVLIAGADDTAEPTLVIEAMARGMPVIATPENTIATCLVRPGRDGVFIEPTARHFDDAMRKFLDDPWLVDRMGRNARDRSRLGDVGAIAEQLVQLLELTQ